MISSEEEISCATTAKPETSKSTDAESPQSRKRKVSPDCEQQSPSKAIKRDIEEDVSSAVSSLITTSNGESVANIFSVVEYKRSLRPLNIWK